MVCGNERRKKDRMDRARETESPNFERTETEKNENKSGTKRQSKANYKKKKKEGKSNSHYMRVPSIYK